MQRGTRAAVTDCAWPRAIGSVHVIPRPWLLDWTAIAAIGTLGLAAATTAAVIGTVRIASADRERDDAKREQDRLWDSNGRKEDRDRHDQLRREERERDDRLRLETADEWERRTRAEQVDREDYEARQVTVQRRQARQPVLQLPPPAQALPQNTDWVTATQKIWEWVATGPKADEPSSS